MLLPADEFFPQLGKPEAKLIAARWLEGYPTLPTTNGQANRENC